MDNVIMKIKPTKEYFKKKKTAIFSGMTSDLLIVS